MRSTSSATPSTVSLAAATDVPSHRGYKPYMERLKAPSFSGKVQDWPEFRSIWKELLSDYPERVQVQHLRDNVPEADKRRIAGVTTMAEVWKRLDKVYGDTKLNIMTVKQNLENFSPRAVGRNFR